MSAAWLVHADRQCWPLLRRELTKSQNDQDLVLTDVSPELGEGWHLLSFVAPVAPRVLNSSSLPRFAYPVGLSFASTRFGRAPTAELQPELALLAKLADRSLAQALLPFAIRRHGRFASERLRELHQDLALPLYDWTRHRNARCLFVASSASHSYAGTLAAREAGTIPALLPPDALLERSDDPSRARAKLTEALVILADHGIRLRPGAFALEFGAYPGGMTSELVRSGFRVHAVDVNPSNEILRKLPGVTYESCDVARFHPTQRYDALVCDVNGPAQLAVREVCRLASSLSPGAPLVYTIKLSTWDSWPTLAPELRACLNAAGYEILALRHLQANRQELTVIGICRGPVIR